MKRIVSVLLVLSLVFSCLLFSPAGTGKDALAAGGEGEFVPVALNMSANLTEMDQIKGYYRDQVFYCRLDDLCEITGLTVLGEDGSQIRLGNRAAEDDSSRLFVLKTAEDEIMEEFESAAHTEEMPAEIIEDEVYVSMFHLFSFLGVGYELDPEGDPQLTVVKWYDMFDAFLDYKESDLGKHFQWDEVEFFFGSTEMNLTYWGMMAMLAEDSNVFHMIFKEKDIYREGLEDNLLTVVSNEGTDYLQEEEGSLAELAGTVLSDGMDWYGFVSQFYKQKKDSTFNKIIDRMSTGKMFVSAGVGMAEGVTEALEFSMQCANMTDAQKNLLKETILKYGQETDMVRDHDFWEIMIDAAEQVDRTVEGKISDREMDLVDNVAETAYSIYENSAGAGTVFSGNFALLVWDTVMGLYSLTPGAEMAMGLHDAYNCSMIQAMAEDITADVLTDLMRNNYYYNDRSAQEEALDELRYAMILGLKATISTREALVRSGSINGIDQTYPELCRETAVLLKKTENASLNGPGNSSSYSDDLSWMEDYVPQGTEAYDLALDRLKEKETFTVVREGTMKAEFAGFQDISFTETMDIGGYGTENMNGGGRYQHVGGTAPYETDYTYTYQNGELKKQYQVPSYGEQTEQRKLIDFALPFGGFAQKVKVDHDENGTAVIQMFYPGEYIIEGDTRLFQYLLPDGFRIYWAPAGNDGEDGIIQVNLTAVVDKDWNFDSITVDYELIGSLQDISRLQGTTVFTFDDKGAEAVQEAQLEDVEGVWLQQNEANPILIDLKKDGSVVYYPTVTEENVYTSTFSLENQTLWINMVNLDSSGVTRVPFLMGTDPAKENWMTLSVDRERAPSLELLYGMDGVAEGEYRRLRFTEEQLAEIGRMLHIPDGRNIEWEQGEASFWDAGECWVIPVRAYEDGRLAAGADFNWETMEMCRNILMYSGN